jgi:foldase protein prsA
MLKLSKKNILLLLFVFILSLLLSACTIAENIAKDEEYNIHVDYTAEQMLLITASRKKHINDFYTKDIWEVTTGDEFGTYKDVFLEEMQVFFIQLKVLNAMAVESGQTLNSKETGDVKDAALKFYEELKSSSVNFGNISYDDVEKMFIDYATALKFRNSIADDKSLEVSENDARVMHLQRIILDDEAKANSIYAEVSAEGADFAAIAKANSIDKNIVLNVGHEDLDPVSDEVVSILSDGQISEVISIDSKFYIYKCIEGYDKDATAAKKTKLLNERIDDKLKNSYNQYLMSKQVDIDDKAWNKMVKELSAIDIDNMGADFMNSFREVNIW